MLWRILKEPIFTSLTTVWTEIYNFLSTRSASSVRKRNKYRMCVYVRAARFTHGLQRVAGDRPWFIAGQKIPIDVDLSLVGKCRSRPGIVYLGESSASNGHAVLPWRVLNNSDLSWLVWCWSLVARLSSVRCKIDWLIQLLLLFPGSHRLIPELMMDFSERLDRVVDYECIVGENGICAVGWCIAFIESDETCIV